MIFVLANHGNAPTKLWTLTPVQLLVVATGTMPEIL